MLFYFVDCSVNVEFPELPEYVACHVTDTCTAVKCCLELGVLKSAATFYLTIDACEQQLEIGIEQLSFVRDLETFEFGIHLAI